jgi:hypothetical protein
MNRRAILALGIPLAGLAVGGVNAEEAPSAAAVNPPVLMPPKPPLFADDVQFWYETQRAFGAAEYGGALFGEVLATSSRIKSGDYDSWYDAWNETSDRIAKEAEDQLSRGHRISARDSYLRAASYYFNSEFFLHANPKDPRIARAYRLSVDCYKHSAALYDPPITPVEIPYEHTTLPGYLHRADGSSGPRPTLIMHPVSTVQPKKCMSPARGQPWSAAITFLPSMGRDNMAHYTAKAWRFDRTGRMSSHQWSISCCNSRASIPSGLR